MFEKDLGKDLMETSRKGTEVSIDTVPATASGGQEAQLPLRGGHNRYDGE